VLGLGEQVGRHPIGMGAVVGDDHHLGGAGQHIDADVPVHELFRGRDELIPGPDDDVYPGNRFRAVRHGRDGLSAAHGENAVDAAQPGHGQNAPVGPRALAGLGLRHRAKRGDARVRGGRRAQDNLADASGPGRGNAHNHAGKQGEPTGRDIHAGAIDGDRALAGKHTRGELGFEIVEGFALAGGEAQGEVAGTANRVV